MYRSSRNGLPLDRFSIRALAFTLDSSARMTRTEVTSSVEMRGRVCHRVTTTPTTLRSAFWIVSNRRGLFFFAVYTSVRKRTNPRSSPIATPIITVIVRRYRDSIMIPAIGNDHRKAGTITKLAVFRNSYTATVVANLPKHHNL